MSVAVLTTAAALALIAAHQCVAPSVAPVIVGIAAHEGRGWIYSYAIHDNISGMGYFPDTAQQAAVIARSLIAIGHASLDLGAGQINTKNLGWTGLGTIERAFDPCLNFAASAAVFFARYNGNPPDEVKAAYAAGVSHEIAALSPVVRPTEAASVSPVCASWDVWAACHFPPEAGVVNAEIP